MIGSRSALLAAAATAALMAVPGPGVIAHAWAQERLEVRAQANPAR